MGFGGGAVEEEFGFLQACHGSQFLEDLRSALPVLIAVSFCDVDLFCVLGS